MNKINFEKLFFNDARGHATLITRPDVHLQPHGRKYDGSRPRPVSSNRFPPAAGGVLERFMDAI
jgi:hypothetical protein